MAINLKQISFIDTNDVKLDKVNYNFDQIVANGGGPRGFQGIIGDQGHIGLTGHKGDQGSFGDQGSQGAAGDSGDGIWTSNTDSTAKTILPVAIDGSPAPSILIGYKSTAPQYINYFETTAKLTINREAGFLNNLELRTEGVSNSFYYRMNNKINAGITTTTMRMGFSSGINGTVIDKYASKFVWIDESTEDELLTLDSDSLIAKVPADFREDVDVHEYLKISGAANPAANSIAVSKNSEGEIEFKTIEEIGGVVPVGTVVSIDPLFFIASNFIIEEIGVNAPDNAPINIRVGAGINNFSGWYICHGKVWTNGAGINRPTSALNSFSYSIDENPATSDPNSQGSVNSSNNNVNLIGGAKIEVDAEYDSPDYDITGSIDNADSSIQTGSGDNFVIKRLPQVIFLGDTSLFWKDKGTGQQDPVTIIYRFIDTNTSATKLTPIQDYTEVNVPGSSFTFTRTITETDGYEFNGVALPISVTDGDGDVSASISYGSNNITFSVDVSSSPSGGIVDITFDSTPIQDEIVIPNEAPTFPSNLRSSDITQTTFTLDWDASTDDSLVASYYIYKRIFGASNPDQLLGDVAGDLTTFEVTGQNAGEFIQVYVKAIDDDGVYSAQSANLSVEMKSEVVEEDPDTGGGNSLTISSSLPNYTTKKGTLDFNYGIADDAIKLSYSQLTTVGDNGQQDSTFFNIPDPQTAMDSVIGVKNFTTGTVILQGGKTTFDYEFEGSEFSVTIKIEEINGVEVSGSKPFTRVNIA
jgi:hypothetical protein